jgi:hypothetical protein
MDSAYSARFSRWWFGTTTSATTYQDDMAVIARATNGFGYRADNHTGTAATATWVASLGNSLSASGIIGRNGDTDMFAFWSGGGAAAFGVRYPVGATRGNLIPMTTSGSSVTGTLPRGVVFVTVSGIGGYASVGQYTLQGTMASTAGYRTTGPRVISAPRSVETYASQTIIRVAFDKPMSVDSLTPANFTLIAPSGRRLRPLSVSVASGAHGGRYFVIRVALREVGAYRLVIGSGVTDTFGNRLDQNGDGIQGDVFSLSIRKKRFNPNDF